MWAPTDAEISLLAYDSRHVKPGAAFFAIEGHGPELWTGGVYGREKSLLGTSRAEWRRRWRAANSSHLAVQHTY